MNGVKGLKASVAWVKRSVTQGDPVTTTLQGTSTFSGYDSPKHPLCQWVTEPKLYFTPFTFIFYSLLQHGLRNY